MAPRLVTAYDTRTGEKRTVPENWFDIPEASTNLSRTDPGVTPRIPEGHNSPTRADDPDFPTAGQVAAADAESGVLKGAALKAALKDAGLSQTGTADEQRAALVTHQEQLDADARAAAEAAALEAIANAEDVDGAPTDSITGDPTNPPAAGDQQ